MQGRGAHLTSADHRFFSGGGILAWLGGIGGNAIINRIDQGLEHGSIAVRLPDGTSREIGGRRAGPMAEITLNSWMPLMRLVQSGSVGWYKSWALGEWESPDPVPIFDLFTRNRNSLGDTGRASGLARLVNRFAHAGRGNSREGARKNIAFHYDLGNDFYEPWLDPSMTYSSALFGQKPCDDSALEVAQRAKMDAICQRLNVSAGEQVLEIGCGWGGLAKHIAEASGASVLGLTLSEEQKRLAEKRCEGLPVEIGLTDYRDVGGQFDAIASVEMVEAVGQEYWPVFLDSISARLKIGGRAALQYISIADDIFDSYSRNADFIQTYIFPGGMLISESRFRALAKTRKLRWQDQHNFGRDYAETLKIWRMRFDRAVHAGNLPAEFDRNFIDLWRYYLMYCEGGFRGGGIDVAQVTLVKEV